MSSKDGHYFYRYGYEERPVIEKQIIVPYRTAHGMAEKKFTAYYTHHGPVIRDQDGKWVTIRLMQEPVKALTQSYLRTKARTYKDYLQTMELQATRRTTPSMPMRMGTSPTFTATSFLAETPSSTLPSRWMGATRRRSGKVC